VRRHLSQVYLDRSVSRLLRALGPVAEVAAMVKRGEVKGISMRNTTAALDSISAAVDRVSKMRRRIRPAGKARR